MAWGNVTCQNSSERGDRRGAFCHLHPQVNRRKIRSEFNPPNARREAAETYVHSQRSLAGELILIRYDGGGFSRGNQT
jgi:hypothetical protein